MKEKDFSQTKEQYIAIATELFEQLSIVLEKLADLENGYLQHSQVNGHIF